MKREEELLSAKTSEEIRRIMEYSQFEIDQASRRIRDELKTFAAGLAVSLASESIHIDKRTDQALIKGFTQSLAHQELVHDRATSSASDREHAVGVRQN